MDINLAKSLILPHKTTFGVMHGTIWFQNIASGLGEPHRSIDVHRKYISVTGDAISIVLAKAYQLRSENDKILTKASNVYGSYKDVQHLLENIKGVDHLYECLLGENPRFFYVDLEWPLVDHEEPGVVIGDIVRFITIYVFTTYSITLNQTLIQISVADGLNTTSSTWKGVQKGSAHVKFPLIFKNSIDCKLFANEVLKLMRESNDKNLKYVKNGCVNTVMDPAVYSKSQNFRMLYCSKFGEKRPLVPLHSSSSVHDHLIGVYDLQAFSRFPVVESVVTKEEVQAKRVSVPKHPRNLGQVDPAAFDHEVVPLAELEEALECLVPARVDHYETWIQLLWVIFNICKSSGYPQEAERLMHEHSGKNHKYLRQEVQKIYNTLYYKESGLHMGSLMHWIREDAPEKFKMLIRKYKKERLYRQAVQENLYFDPHTELDTCFECLEYAEPYVRDYDLKNFAGVAVMSGLGTGKTTQLAKFVTSPDFPKIIVFSNRNLFGIDIMKTLNEIVRQHYGDDCAPDLLFRSHLDFANKMFPKNVDRLVIQMESVHKLAGHQFDLVILDESEAALTQFSAPTMRNLRKCAEEFFRICREASKFIVCDGFLTKRTTNVIKHILAGTDKKCLIHLNTHLVADKEAYHLPSATELTHALIKVLENGQRPAMFTASKRIGMEVAQTVEKHFTDKVKIRFYNADADDEEMLEEMADVNQAWVRVDFLLYSPVITNGVNFTAEHYDCMFLYGSASSCCVSQVMQAARRVRNLSQKRVYFYANPMYFGVEKTHWNFESVEKELKTNQKFISEYFDYERRHLLSAVELRSNLMNSFAEDMLQNEYEAAELLRRVDALKATLAIIQNFEQVPPWLWDVLIRNRIEVNLSRSMYETLFKDYLKRIGVKEIYQYDVDNHELQIRPEIQFVGNDGESVNKIFKYADIEEIDMETAKLYMDEKNAKKGTCAHKKAIERWFFDNYQVLNRRTPFDIRQQVFDGFQDQQKKMTFDLLLKEHSETVGSLIEDMVLHGNPFLETYSTHIHTVPAMQRLCETLGIRSSLDDNTVFSSEHIVENIKEITKPLDELYSRLGIRDRAKKVTKKDAKNKEGKEAGEDRKNKAPTKIEILDHSDDCKAKKSDLDTIVKRLNAVFGAWNKSKMHSTSHQIRKGNLKGTRRYEYTLINKDEFITQVKIALMTE